MISTSDHETGGLSDAVQLNASVYPVYNWYPAPLSKVSHSAEWMASKLANLPPLVDRSDFVKRIVLKDWMGLDTYEVDELVKMGDVDYLVNSSNSSTQTELAYKLGLISSKRAQIGW